MSIWAKDGSAVCESTCFSQFKLNPVFPPPTVSLHTHTYTPPRMYLQYKVLKLYKINLHHGDLKISGLNNSHLSEFEINSVNVFCHYCWKKIPRIKTHSYNSQRMCIKLHLSSSQTFENDSHRDDKIVSIALSSYSANVPACKPVGNHKQFVLVF